MSLSPADLLAIGQIIWIDLLLSGDNAVVIALACRSLPERQRRIGIWVGAGAAVGLRIVFAYVISHLLNIPFLQVVGGLLLLWIALKLLTDDHAPEEGEIKASTSLWGAVGTIAMADAVMSLDNVVAIAAIAGENYALFVFGLALSIPLIVVGASLITGLIQRFPILVWAGAALLGWIGGRMIADDHHALLTLGLALPQSAHVALAAACAAAVVVIGYLLKKREASATKL
jgi:YjbE family integral membrane protein